VLITIKIFKLLEEFKIFKTKYKIQFNINNNKKYIFRILIIDMNLTPLERYMKNLLSLPNRPLINILSLEHVMNYDSGGEKEYSTLLKSCFFFL